MAKAPKPGAVRRIGQAEDRKASARSIDMTVDGDQYRLALPLPTGEQRALRLATGMTLQQFFSSGEGRMAVGSDSLSVFWWLARRQGGDTQLQLSAVDDEIDALMDEHDDIGDVFTLQMVEPDDGDPDPES